jgi:hypothetical protein
VSERGTRGSGLQPEEVKLGLFNGIDTTYPHGHGQIHSDGISTSVNNSLKYVTNIDDKQYGWVVDKFHKNQIFKNMDYFFTIHSPNDIASMDQFTEDAQGQDNNINIRVNTLKDNKFQCSVKIDYVQSSGDKVSQLDYFDVKGHTILSKCDFVNCNNDKIAELDYFENNSSPLYHMYDY